MIGLAGAHRCGKTTLAKAYADKFGIEFMKTDSAGVFERFGLDPQSDYSFSDRLFLQNEILNEAIKVYKQADFKQAITDRTPIDMLAYMMADIKRETLTENDDLQFMEYFGRCMETANRYMSVVVIVQPGIPVKDDPTKATATFGYIQHISDLIKGVSLSEMLTVPKYYIGSKVLELSSRMVAIEKAIDKAYGVESDSNNLIGVGIH